jgi:hypothetical protein
MDMIGSRPTHAWKPSGSWLEVPAVITFAFYGRVGQPRLQDVAASKAWQLHRALALIKPHSGSSISFSWSEGNRNETTSLRAGCTLTSVGVSSHSSESPR